MAGPVHSGSRATIERGTAGTAGAVAAEEEWLAAEMVDRHEARARRRGALAGLVPPAVVAALLPAILSLTPGFSATDTIAAVVASAIAAGAAIGVVPLANRAGAALPNSGAGDRLLFMAALASAGAAAIHFSAIKMHFDEYTLYGLFFVGSSIAQLVWPIWLLLRRWAPLLVLGAIGNATIVALWVVDRAGAVPIGPDATKPPPYGLGDSVTSGLEALLVIACIAALVRRQGRRLRLGATLLLTVGTAALTALAFLSVLGVAPSVLPPTR